MIESIIDRLATFDWNEASLRWALAWFLALLATWVNLRKDITGLRATLDDMDAEGSVIASAWWFARQNLLKFIACTLMVIAGANAVSRGQPDSTRMALELAAYVICGNQIWNMFDRWRVEWFLRRERHRARHKGMEES